MYPIYFQMLFSGGHWRIGIVIYQVDLFIYFSYFFKSSLRGCLHKTSATKKNVFNHIRDRSQTTKVVVGGVGKI